MKCDTTKLSQKKGSSVSGETVPLFPALHVNQTGKSGVRAPPRNRMAMYEQFTIPYNRHFPLNEVADDPRQHGTSECYHATPATLAYADNSKCAVNTNVKSSYSSSLCSLSTCSAVVSMGEEQMIQIQEPAESTSPLFVSKFGLKPGKSTVKVSEDEAKDVNEASGIELPRHNNHHGTACGRPVMSESFHKCDDGSAGGTFNSDSPTSMERWHDEAATNCEDLPLAGCQLSGPEVGKIGVNGSRDVLESEQSEASSQLKSSGQRVECQGSTAEPFQKPGFVSQASIKPKDVIQAVGQQLFWKARKAILRQQEVFSNQLFELHKLIKVQKFMAKMPNTFIDEHMLLETAPDKLGYGYPSNKGDSDEQENLADGRAGTLAPFKKCGGPARRSKSQGRLVVGAGVHAKKSSHNSTLPQVLTNASFGQPCQSLSSDGKSAWGYPIGSLNRPLIYPPGASNFPSRSAYGGVYAVGPNPPMTPFTFPCYGQRPEHTYNQWPATMYHNPFLAPFGNDWFAMNHQGQVSVASGSETARPTYSVASINTKAEASTHSSQPAVAPCIQQQLGTGSYTRLVDSRSVQSHATANASVPPNALSKKSGPGYEGEQNSVLSPDSGSGSVFKFWGAFGGENKADIDTKGRARGIKEGGQLSTSSAQRQVGMHVDNPRGGNALNLFPLQPLSSSGILSNEGSIARENEVCQGQVIKAVPRSALAASEWAAGILLSIQRERQL